MKDTSKQRKAELYAHLKSAVMTLELRPGADLDEASLSEDFSLSRTPLREVFRQLAGEGYLDLRENRGARVSEMSHTTLRDFFLAAPMVYGAVLQLAAQNARPEQIVDLKAAQEDFKAALHRGDGAARAMANNRFHEVTGEMADNIYLMPSFQRLLIDHARISMTFYRPQDARMADNVSEASAQHDAIIAAIEVKDATAAAQLAIDHWNLSRDQIELFVMPAGLDMPLGTMARKTPA
ncbi:GntR family transcriptional regulator [Phaeobacter gallaeciensis]|uniref:GntR family transcriptional regulator n=2 Tax=Roseobacteraceae TaxID=2854170 RepID=A0A366X5V0_9RHOB|nr:MULTISPECIES: GntR family transcriptional regulator [Roseobacteraceae]MBT3142518.1 GntR family transcriptional regulator [Falsiruegeria litorea]MBT8169254.1 GntR family transcriptional regulator [Falsiruegeria litorea]RBW60493.1 GntR family transcriptional regulator [Phaeobacter gallaeciensis]